MSVLHDKILHHLSGLIHKGLEKAFPEHGLKLEDIYQQIGEPPNLKMGHYAFACFPLAKALKMGPPQIAAKLCEQIESDPLVKESKNFGPYLNFFLKPEAFGEHCLDAILNGEFFKRQLTDELPRMMIEYSQPNTHKELHVGHMRNLCLGNALVELNRYVYKDKKDDVVAATFPGDVGTHVAKCLWYLRKYNKEQAPEFEKGAWLGRMYSSANNLLEDEKGTPKEEQNRQELTAILKQLHDEKGEYYDLWKETREWSIDLMKEAYEWAGVEFDRWFWESEVDAPSVKTVKKFFDAGKFVKDQGAIGMDLKDDNLGFCLLIKSDGTGLYATKDLELARKKFEEFKIEKNIYVVDNRQALHFKQVFKVLEKLGFEQAQNCFHLQYDVVELPDGAMSSRKGNIVPLMDLIRQMEKKIIDDYLEKYRGKWSDQEILKTASDVAGGAIKYGMIRVDNNRKIVFDMNEWLKLDGETGPYLQYAYARINSLSVKFHLYELFQKIIKGEEKSFNWSTLQMPQEQALLLKLSSFNSVALNAAKTLKSMHMCSYLYDLSKLFNSFYVECPIGKEPNQDLQRARLALSHCVGVVLKQGLSTLGIAAPERM